MMNSEIDQDVNDGATIKGWVRSSDSEPLEDAVVLICGDSPTHKEIAALTDKHGRYQYQDLTPGVYTVLVNSERNGIKKEKISISPSEVASLNFKF